MSFYELIWFKICMIMKWSLCKLICTLFGPSLLYDLNNFLKTFSMYTCEYAVIKKYLNLGTIFEVNMKNCITTYTLFLWDFMPPKIFDYMIFLKRPIPPKHLWFLVPAPFWHLISIDFLQWCRLWTFLVLFWTNIV